MLFRWSVFGLSLRYILGVEASVLEEVENAFETYQFYKASQVRFAASETYMM